MTRYRQVCVRRDRKSDAPPLSLSLLLNYLCFSRFLLVFLFFCFLVMGVGVGGGEAGISQ